MANLVSMKALLEAGVHFGHQTRRWDPRMERYIFTKRNGIHIIDLQQTVTLLGAAYDYVRDLVADGGVVMFVGTKKQAQETIDQEAIRAQMPYVSQRWLGGMLTNFQTIQGRVDYLVRLENRQSKGELDFLPKKEALKIVEQIVRLNRYVGGIKELTALPSALFIIDPEKERIAVAEALRLDIPIVAPVDTNCNPDEIAYPIPANDDAIRAIRLLTAKIADACVEGLAERESRLADMAEAADVDDEVADAAAAAGGHLVFSPDEPTPGEVVAEGEAESKTGTVSGSDGGQEAPAATTDAKSDKEAEAVPAAAEAGPPAASEGEGNQESDPAKSEPSKDDAAKQPAAGQA